MTMTIAKNVQTIVQISDSHLMDCPDADFVKINPEYSFKEIIQHIRHHHHVDALVHTGDVAQVATAKTYERYLDYMESLNIPFYQTPGNHDDLNIFPYSHHQPVSITHMGKWSMVLVNSAVDGQIDGAISHKHLTELDHVLAQYPHQFIFIACHHHPLHMDSAWIDQHKLKNSDDFMQVLHQYSNVKAVIHGHVHQEYAEVVDGIHFLSVPSTCVQFKPQSDDFELDPIAPGYRILKLYDDGQFETQVKRVPAVIQHINEEILGY